jgi:hypothetical protein
VTSVVAIADFYVDASLSNAENMEQIIVRASEQDSDDSVSSTKIVDLSVEATPENRPLKRNDPLGERIS